MSEKRSIFRRIEWVSCPPPTRTIRSGGVIRRQTRRARLRSSERRDEHDREGGDREGGADLGQRRDLEEEGERCDARDRPGEDDRQLVDGEVPERPVIAVVEPVELRRHDPDRQEDQRSGSSAYAGPEDDEGEADEDAGTEIGQGEQAPAQRIARRPDPAPGRRCILCRCGKGLHPERGAARRRLAPRRGCRPRGGGMRSVGERGCGHGRLEGSTVGVVPVLARLKPGGGRHAADCRPRPRSGP